MEQFDEIVINKTIKNFKAKFKVVNHWLKGGQTFIKITFTRSLEKRYNASKNSLKCR